MSRGIGETEATQLLTRGEGGCRLMTGAGPTGAEGSVIMGNISITFTRTSVEEVTVSVEEIMKAIQHMRQLPSYGGGFLDSVRTWLEAWDGEEEMPSMVWDAIQDFGLQSLAGHASIETVDERLELDEVAEVDE